LSEIPRDSERAVQRLRGILRDANYTPEGIRRIGVDVGLGIRRTDVPLLRRALAAAEPLSGLVRLFLLGEALQPAEAQRLFGDGVDPLARAGFLERRRGRVLATLSITPWAGLLVAHDPDPSGDLWSAHVTGPNPAAETLARLTIRTRVRSVLDLGTGSGVLALLAARHAEQVVATDINRHALRLVQLNSQLNEVRNVEPREGSFFEPVVGERFDLIVADPPYVISPESDLVFRYGSLPRDEVSRHVVAESAAHLADGGFAEILCNWIVPLGEDWRAVPTRWVAGSGCDAVVLHHGTESAVEYAARMNLRLNQLSPERYDAALERWLAFYRSEGIEAIASGALVLRRRQGMNWIHAVEMTNTETGDATRQLLAIFAGLDYLSGLESDAATLADAFALPDRHRLDQSLVYRDGRYTLQPASLALEDGLGLRAVVDPALVGIVLRFDGARPLGEILSEVARENGTEGAEFTAAGIALGRDLLGRGLLQPPSRVGNPRAGKSGG
jgi:SAM-dependent methyltransferase